MDKKKVIILCAAIALMASFVTGMLVYFSVVSKEKGNEIRVGAGSYEDIKKYMEISDLEKIINDTYYQNVEEKALIDGAMKGMVGSLNDPYSAYYTEEEYKEYNDKNSGTFVGIGAAAGPYNGSGQLKIETVYAGSPAETAGLHENDIITAVDGVALAKMDYEGALNLIQGPSGSTVVLAVLSDGQMKEVSIVRAEVQTQFVFYTMLDEQIANIVITEFHGKCVDEFKAALQFVKDEGAKGIVIDLRGNLGGNMKDAIDMLDEIMPPSLLVYTIDKNDKRDEWKADDQYTDIPITVLVDGNSASSSEIFAAAVQDNARGKIVGTQTYGKGVVQSIVDMPYSGGGVKLTNAVYYTPSGKMINDTGITPDEVVELPADLTKLTQETDTQLQKGIEVVRSEIAG
ncbi:MAG: S41 family peptidase [Christensenellaceae bacterium]